MRAFVPGSSARAVRRASFRLATLVVPVAMGAVLVASGPAFAGTFPGHDGRILFHSDKYGATHNVFTMTPDGSDVRQLTFLTSDTGAAFDASWSADGSRIVFRERPSGTSTLIRGLYLMNADGSGQHLLYADPAYTVQAPSFSPDGSRVVFSRCPIDGSGCAIYAIRSTGAGLTAITTLDSADGVFDLRPQYSPDGGSIAFTGFNRDGPDSAAVYVVRPDGGGLRRVTDPALGASQPDWSPDGTSLIVVGGDSAIWRVGAADANPTMLYNPVPNGLEQPRYSPTGTRIVFDRFNPNARRGDPPVFTLMEIDADGGNAHVLSNGSYSSNSWYADWGTGS